MRSIDWLCLSREEEAAVATAEEEDTVIREEAEEATVTAVEDTRAGEEEVDTVSDGKSIFSDNGNDGTGGQNDSWRGGNGGGRGGRGGGGGYGKTTFDSSHHTSHNDMITVASMIHTVPSCRWWTERRSAGRKSGKQTRVEILIDPTVTRSPSN